MNLDRIVPGVHVPDLTGVAGHVPGRTEEYAAQVHQFAEGEIGQQDTDQKQMGEEQTADTLGNRGPEGHQAHGQFFDGNDIHLGKIAHENTGKRDSHDQKQGEKVGCQGDIPNLGDHHPAQKEVKGGGKQHQPGHIDPRKPLLHGIVKHFHAHEAVHVFKYGDEEGNRLREKSQVPQHNGEESVVEGQGADP
ncbi:hypothetical protein DESC_870047 [Desulfosarcina cetonica]|nr:hypothetical protein DESC_870047 [Desulfosarcina cetonica]